MAASRATARSTSGFEPGGVRADLEQVLGVAVRGEQLAQGGRVGALLGRGDGGRDAGDRLEDVDAREVAGGREAAGQHDVAVEDRAGGVADRLVHVVALDEDGVEAGDAAGLAGAGALEQLGEQGEDRRRVAAGGGHLAGRQADLALGHGEARDAVHHEHDVAALVAEVLGDAGGGQRGAQAHERRLVGGGDDDDRAGESLRTEVVLEELPDLAAALADQGDDRDVGLAVAGDHRQQARLADAGAGEDAEALAAADGDERVEGAHAEGERGVDPRPAQRVRRGAGRRRPAAGARGSGPPSTGRPRPSSTRPSRASPRPTVSGPPVACTAAPVRTPCIVPNGMQTRPPSRRATTSAGSAVPSTSTRTASPMAASRPSTSRLSPTTRRTRPVTQRRGGAQRGRDLQAHRSTAATRARAGPTCASTGGRRPRRRSRRARRRGRRRRRARGPARRCGQVAEREDVVGVQAHGDRAVVRGQARARGRSRRRRGRRWWRARGRGRRGRSTGRARRRCPRRRRGRPAPASRKAPRGGEQQLDGAGEVGVALPLGRLALGAGLRGGALGLRGGGGAGRRRSPRRSPRPGRRPPRRGGRGRRPTAGAGR